ncbi:hypothetical protein [Neisseria sp. oral taxon 014]|uniref:hypothetical protein n=1 Tax=Neisseria sp. oral taxon 014 TaxID=641148 RepID=UPI0025CCC45A|nr:hypothetical protein [Neisseria sp. oral taxon 014]
MQMDRSSENFFRRPFIYVGGVMVSKRICPAVCAAAFVPMVYAAPPFDGNPLVYGKCCVW